MAGLTAADHERARGKVWPWACLRCGAEFMGRINQIYCSAKCSRKRVKKGPEPPSNCARCGKPLDVPREGKRGPKRRYCGEACKRAANYRYVRKRPKAGAGSPEG